MVAASYWVSLLIQLLSFVWAWYLWRIWELSVLKRNLSKCLRNSVHICYIFWDFLNFLSSTLSCESRSNGSIHIWYRERCLLLIASLEALCRTSLDLLIFHISPSQKSALAGGRLWNCLFKLLLWWQLRIILNHEHRYLKFHWVMFFFFGDLRYWALHMFCKIVF